MGCGIHTNPNFKLNDEEDSSGSSKTGQSLLDMKSTSIEHRSKYTFKTKKGTYVIQVGLYISPDSSSVIF